MILEIIIFLAIAGIVMVVFYRVYSTKAQIREGTVVNKPKKSSSKDVFDKKTWQSQLAQADELFVQKNYKQAEKIYVRLIAADPKNPKIYNRLGALFLEENNFSDAKAAFSEALKFDGKIASRWYNFGLACSGLQEYRNALEAYEKALNLDTNNEKYLQSLKEAKGKIKNLLEKK